MVSALISELSSPGLSPGGGDIVLCSWARNLNLTVALSGTQVYKWGTCELNAGGNPAMD